MSSRVEKLIIFNKLIELFIVIIFSEYFSDDRTTDERVVEGACDSEGTWQEMYWCSVRDLH